jgi:hypothetical protein
MILLAEFARHIFGAFMPCVITRRGHRDLVLYYCGEQAFLEILEGGPCHVDGPLLALVVSGRRELELLAYNRQEMGMMIRS